jgi:aryl-alcohol dehydrogenase-like predicted oxidoreductase
MDYRQFGQTDLQGSAMGFGCWEIGGTYGKIAEAQFQQAVQRAIDAGINCFDTAEAYGRGASEQALARALGTRRKEENLGALGWAVSEADMAAIDALFARHGAVSVPLGWLEDA